MIEYIHLSRSLSGKLSMLRRAGKKGELAVEQFWFLLNSFRQNRIQDAKVYCKRTKNGEARIENCIKYDLGNGYRLITVLIGTRLFIPFLGNHDETGVWLDRHKHDVFSENNPAYDCEQVFYSEDDGVCEDDNHCLEKERDIYEEHLLAMVDDSILRDVFRGLYR
jgi:hypothetical protein